MKKFIKGLVIIIIESISKSISNNINTWNFVDHKERQYIKKELKSDIKEYMKQAPFDLTKLTCLVEEADVMELIYNPKKDKWTIIYKGAGTTSKVKTSKLMNFLKN